MEKINISQEKIGQVDGISQLLQEVLNKLQNIESSSEKKESTKNLTIKLLDEIEQKYGKDGRGEKPYHDLDHSIEVIQDSFVAFDYYLNKYPDLLDKEDMLLVAIAGAGHDIVQEYSGAENPGKNEQESAKQVLDEIDSDGRLKILFNDQEKSAIGRMILATIFDFKEHRQKFTHENIQSKEDVMERIVALCDLMALGDFDRQHWRGNRLFWEINSNKYNDANLDGKIELAKNWFEGQIRFLTNQEKYLEKFDDFVNDLFPDILTNIKLYEEILDQVDILQQKYLSMELPQKEVKIELEKLLSVDRVIVGAIKQNLGLAKQN